MELSPCSNHRASEKVKAVEVVTGSVEIQLRFDVSRERQGLLAGLSAGGGGRAGSTEFEDAAVCLAPAGPTRDAMREMDAENKLLLLRAWRRSESSQEARQPPPPLPGRRSAAEPASVKQLETAPELLNLAVLDPAAFRATFGIEHDNRDLLAAEAAVAKETGRAGTPPRRQAGRAAPPPRRPPPAPRANSVPARRAAGRRPPPALPTGP